MCGLLNASMPESVKSLLSHAPVLVNTNPSKSFKMVVDSSTVGADTVLLQEDGDGVDHPVCYFLHKFHKHESNPAL